MNETMQKVHTILSEQEQHEIFERWLEKIQQIISIIEYRGPFNQQKIYRFYSSLMRVIHGEDSFLHFQLLDSFIPLFRKYQISEQDTFLVLSQLREIILNKFLEKNVLSPQILNRILQKFDEVITFVQRSVLLQMQISKDENPLNLHSVADQVPIGIFYIEGDRFSGRFYPNVYLQDFLGWNKNEPITKSFWHKHLSAKEKNRLKKFFTELYSLRTRHYRIQYSLKVGETTKQVLEEGVIYYTAGGAPLTINGTIQSLSLIQKLKERLILEQKKYQLLRQLSAHLIIMCDSQGKIINFNPSLLKELGISPDRFLGSAITDWFYPGEQTRPTSFRQLIKRYQKSEKKEVSLRFRFAERIRFQTRMGALKTPNNDLQYLFVGWQSGILDERLKQRLDLLISIQKELTLEADSNNLYNKILENAIKLISVADAGSILQVEPDGLHFKASYGYDADELKRVILFKGNIQKYIKISSQARMIRENINIQEIRDIHKEAEKIFCPKDLSVLREHGKLNEIRRTLSGIIYKDSVPHLLLNLDILSPKKSFSEDDKYLFNIYLQVVFLVLRNYKLIEQLQISESNYRILFENSPVPTFIHQDNRFVLANPTFFELSGYSPDEIKNVSIWELVHPEDKPMMVNRAYKRLVGEDVPSVYEFRAVKKSGEIIRCIGYFSRIIYNDRPAVLGEISDITHIKSLEKQLMQAQKLETIGTLTAGIAHDFNNIIGTIAPSAQLIMMDPAHPQTAKRAEIIYNMAQRAGQLTSQLLAFTRNEKSEVVPFNINKIIQDSLSLIEKSIHVRIKLKLELDEQLYNIEGDPNQFIQIIMNLVVNANDAMPDGGELVIKTQNVYADNSYKQLDSSFNEGNYVLFSVRDTGVGIPAEIRDKIFDPFFTTKKRGKGTGLGLSMVYGITKSHNGIILLKSEPGKGTEFQLFFPASQKSLVAPTTHEEETPTKGGGTILAIDDEQDLRVILDSILKYLGYQVFMAKDGKEGIEIFKKHHQEIDLVLLDYMLPDSDGREIFRKLQQIKPGVNVLVCSGYSEREGIQELLREGVKGVLPKPFTIESISKKLKEVLKN